MDPNDPRYARHRVLPEVGPDGQRRLVDVRSPEEWAICRIEGARLISLHEIPGRLAEIDREVETVLYGHVGVRSAYALEFLRGRGFARTFPLVGGIETWANEVESEMARY